MRKIYKKLTDAQRQRNVIFSSCLSVNNTEGDNDTIHEVIKGDSDGNETIQRLLNDSFFNNSPYKVNIIRQ